MISKFIKYICGRKINYVFILDESLSLNANANPLLLIGYYSAYFCYCSDDSSRNININIHIFEIYDDQRISSIRIDTCAHASQCLVPFC